ncbi:MAG TPA: SpvB/TcaC N-terminal domain-containing protein [Chitinophagaceae bacterium]
MDMVKNKKDVSKGNLPIQVPSINLPKGGGSLRGIGDTFSPDLFTGTSNFSIPISLTAARGLEPQLSVDYSSGSGNSEFGLGFSLSLNKISLTTDRGIPRYEGSDIHMLSGEGELVKKKSDDNLENPRIENENAGTYIVTVYLQRLESQFSKIEEWLNTETNISYWKVITRDNITSYYGRTDNSRISNPENELQVFEWLIDETCDAKGNKILYDYKCENLENVPPAVFEVDRLYKANRYIRSIKYGNYRDASNNDIFAFEVLFNYGEYDLPVSENSIQKEWACRPDPFSTYRSGFEIRTYRRCESILLYHHFEKELGDPCLVRSVSFGYNNIQQYNLVAMQGLSLLSTVQVTGYRRNDDGSISKQAMPELLLSYSAFKPPVSPEFKILSMGDDTIPGYIDGSQFLPVDLHGDGLPGFLYSNKEVTFYLEPEGDGRYTYPDSCNSFPNNKDLQNAAVLLTDIDGNGQLELVVNNPGQAGYYQSRDDGSWDNFRSFLSYPNDIFNSNIESADLDANGKTDLILPRSQSLLIYYSKGKEGYSNGKLIPNENGFPKKQNNAGALVTFADMFGDGLAHRARISNGLVECWPSLGYGQYGKKVTIGNAPFFGDDFNSKRLFVADIDGSGTADLAYVYSDRVEIYINQSGNSFSDPVRINLPDLYSDIDQISFSDILGNGVSCLVFSKMAQVPVHYYYCFTGSTLLDNGITTQSIKPYLLTEFDNNLGTLTRVNYCSSTRFYLEDKRTGRPWVTKLHFPVQVVEQITAIDRISGSTFVRKFKYHDGYYDTTEKTFCGFGYIESWDSETFEGYKQLQLKSSYPIAEISPELYVPPVYTRTWYNTGSYKSQGIISKQYKSEYFKGDKEAYDFPDSVFSSGVYRANHNTLMQAYFALKGNLIRKEVYADDNTPDSCNPYTVSESNMEVVLIQPADEKQHAVFLVHARESITYNYERNPLDPTVQQDFILETDLLCGLAKKTCTIFLPRRLLGDIVHKVYPEQKLIKANAGWSDYIDTKDTDPYRWRGVEYKDRQFEIFNLDAGTEKYFSFNDVKTQLAEAFQNIVKYEGDLTEGKLQARQLTWNNTYFWNEDQTDVLSLSYIACRGLLHHSEQASFTKEVIDKSFKGKLSDDVISKEGGYIFDTDTGYWWNKGLVQHYFLPNEPEAFFMPTVTDNAFVDKSSSLYRKVEVSYNKPYNFLPVVLKDCLDENTVNEERFFVDYQTNQYYQSLDFNKNISQVLFDPMGQVIVSSLFGIENNTKIGGMRLYEYDGEPAEYIMRLTGSSGEPVSFNDVITHTEYYLQGAVSYFYYNLNAWKEGQGSTNFQPQSTITLLREQYYHLPEGDTPFQCQLIIEFYDGLGRCLEKKQKVGPGMAFTRDAYGKLVRDAFNEVKQLITNDRFVVSGRTVYNNKGKPCEEYFPYYSNNPFYESQEEMEKLLPPPITTYYDPLLRIIRVVSPKKFFSKIEYLSWEQRQYDEDDTVKDAEYYIEFMKNYPADPTQAQKDEKDALDKAALFYDTPVTTINDNTGYQIFSRQILVKKELPGNLLPPEKRELTSYQVNDIQGRILEIIDPRLYLSNCTKGTNYYNFRYRYMMDDDTPFYTDSADAGTQLHFSNIFGNLCWSYSARDYCQFITYDRLQRKKTLHVKKVEAGAVVIPGDFNLVEIFTYGETRSDADKYNLRGKLYQLNDLSGVVINTSYSMQGQLLTTSRYMAADYKTAIDWNKAVELDENPLLSIFNYNALKCLLSETTPDGTMTSYTYEPRGLPEQITVTYADGVVQPIVNRIEYDANKQRISIEYANEIITTYTYETTTSRLIRLLSKRPVIAATNAIANDIIQDISYTYDPVGNITRKWDYSFETVFNRNQEVNPCSDYLYDSLYRVINANGRQHPGINSNTYKNNKSDGSFKQSRFSQLPLINDAEKLENYFETFTYDDGGNLVEKQHTALSASFTTETPVEDYCNRLLNLEYDASGNQRQLNINNVVSLGFNCCENLVKAAIIERDEMDDSDYYVYDSNEMRTRKVSERMANGGATTEILDVVYAGNYIVTQDKAIAAKGNTTIKPERHTVRVMCNTACVAIINYEVTNSGIQRNGSAETKSIRFQMDDNIGSVSLEMSVQALMISYEEYFSFGGTAIIAGENQVEVALKVYRYSGKECDDSTGLYYYGARYYISWLGRWLNCDPAGTVDGLNLYEFVGNNPIKMIDPDGKQKRALDTDALVESVRYMTSHELETSLKLANRVFDEAYANPALFTDENARFSPALETDLTDFINTFSGAFVAANQTLEDALKAAGANDDEQTTSQLNAYKYLRGKSNTSIAAAFPKIDFVATSTASPKGFELHHIIYKAMDPQNATTAYNFAMATRGSAGSGFVGTHEGLFHLITSGNDSTIYKTAVAGVSGLFKRIIKSKVGDRKFLKARKGGTYSASTAAKTKDFRSPSMRLQIIAARKREKAGGTTRFFKLKPGQTTNPMKPTYHF